MLGVVGHSAPSGQLHQTCNTQMDRHKGEKKNLQMIGSSIRSKNPVPGYQD